MPSSFVETYRTLVEPVSAQLVDRRSRFISVVFPIAHEREVSPLLASQHREHHGARHCCSAYILGADASYERMDDDGEPSGSAGRPILNALRSGRLTNVLGVVVRYFGGIKLGVPGLIGAYRGVVEAALASGQVVEREVVRHMHLRFAYAQQHEVMGIVKCTGGMIESATYEADCECVARWPIALYALAQQRLGHVATVTLLPIARPY